MAYKYSTKLMKIQQNYGTGKRMLWCIGENNGNMLPECSIIIRKSKCSRVSK